jgi:NADH-quinone oxidoreductase subunit H
VSVARVLNSATSLSTREVLLYMGVPLAVILLAAAFWPQRRIDLDDDEPEPDDELLVIEQQNAASDIVSPRLGAYPIPPMDLQVPIAPIRSARPALPMSGAGGPATSKADTSEGASSVVS